MLMYTTITYSKQERVAVVTLNRPKVDNAISRLMTRELDLAFNQACIDDEIRCIVLRSESVTTSWPHPCEPSHMSKWGDVRVWGGQSRIPQET